MEDAFKYIGKLGVHNATSYPSKIEDNVEMIIPSSQTEIDARFNYMTKHCCDVQCTRDELERVTICYFELLKKITTMLNMWHILQGSFKINLVWHG